MPKCALKNRSAVLFALLLLSLPSYGQSDSAFTISPGTYSAYVYIQQSAQILERNRATLFGPDGVQQSQRIARGSKAAPLSLQQSKASFVHDGSIDTPSRLSEAYPPAQRSEARALFRELLAGYSKIEQQFGLSRRDAAGAVAAFLAGSFMAYHNADFPDEDFKPLVNQMRQVIDTNPSFAKASNAERQEMYEQMAILGMLMATTQMALKEQPNPQIAARAKESARGYIEQFLKTDIDRVQITGRGLIIR